MSEPERVQNDASQECRIRTGAGVAGLRPLLVRLPSMQPHEGPRPDPEQERQRKLTIVLIGIIGALVGALIIALAGRYR